MKINLYGALRDADPRGFLELDVAETMTVARLREQVKAYLREQAPHISITLVERSAFANNDSILHDDIEVMQDAELAILPPVSGG